MHVELYLETILFFFWIGETISLILHLDIVGKHPFFKDQFFTLKKNKGKY